MNNIRIMEELNYEVELIEEQQDMDIQAIKEFDRPSLAINNFPSISEEIKYLHIAFNELLQVVKQLDRKIREER